MFIRLGASLFAAVLAIVLLATSTSAVTPATGTVIGAPATAVAPVNVSTLASAVGPYTPPAGALFSLPFGTHAEKFRITDRIERTISGTRKGSTIRIATWAIDVRQTADKLISAHKRGVNVRMILNQHADTGQLRRLQRVLGTDTSARSFAITCSHGCRGSQPATMHSKFYLFSQVGRASNVVMISSGNLTRGTIYRGFNDLFTVVNKAVLYGGFVRTFGEMSTRRAVKSPYRVTTSGRYQAYFYPRPGTTKYSDTIYENLSKVRCHGANGGAGVDGKTIIRVSMFFIAGDRGEYLARKLLSLDNSGCIVKVIFGALSPEVSQILRRRGKHDGIDVRNSRHDVNGDGEVDKRVHTKYTLINGVYAGDASSWHVFTGSENWTPASLRRSDEVTLRIRGQSVHKRYVANFNHVYRTASRPTGYSN
ncbi:MAG: phospholipase D-like domain-containing protein [Actinomycetota bacterium]|nr:phospholipase D-like domain-containing protein [Actinomycetota bacterium]